MNPRISMVPLNRAEQEAVHQIHVSLGCSKRCARCGEVRPIADFGQYGTEVCGACDGWPEGWNVQRFWRTLDGTGWTAKELAHRAGLSVHTVYAWTQGRNNPTEKSWQKVARAFRL